MSSRDQLLAALVKVAGDSRADSLVEKAEQIRPWVRRGVTAAVPAGLTASFLLPFADSAAKRRAVAGAALLGGAAGITDMALARSARSRKSRRKAETMRKVAALAADLRMKGLGGVKRPPFPTLGSLSRATKSLNKSQKVGKLEGMAKPKDLVKPGPSIAQVAPKPV